MLFFHSMNTTQIVTNNSIGLKQFCRTQTRISNFAIGFIFQHYHYSQRHVERQTDRNTKCFCSLDSERVQTTAMQNIIITDNREHRGGKLLVSLKQLTYSVSDKGLLNCILIGTCPTHHCRHVLQASGSNLLWQVEKFL